MTKSTEQQVVALFVQAMRTALALIDEKPVKPARRETGAKLARGIYPAQSKYNPFRAYAWNGTSTVYLGMFPSVAAAKRAQREFRAGKQPSAGTRAPARVVTLRAA